MPFALEQLSQGISIAAHCDPTSLNNSALTSGAVDMSKFRRIMAVIQTGAVAGSITAKLQGSATSGGSYADISGATATAITAANKQATIELRDDECTSAQAFVKLVITETASAASLASGVILGAEAAAKPAKAQDPASVVQRLVV